MRQLKLVSSKFSTFYLVVTLLTKYSPSTSPQPLNVPHKVPSDHANPYRKTSTCSFHRSHFNTRWKQFPPYVETSSSIIPFFIFILSKESKVSKYRLMPFIASSSNTDPTELFHPYQKTAYYMHQTERAEYINLTRKCRLKLIRLHSLICFKAFTNEHQCVFCFLGKKETNSTIYTQNTHFLPLERFGGTARLNQKYLSFRRDRNYVS